MANTKSAYELSRFSAFRMLGKVPSTLYSRVDYDSISDLLQNIAGVLVYLLLAVGSLEAVTYYVDFSSGCDSNSGLSPSAAWKRSPGDSAAIGFAGRAILQPGDTVLFRGGVTYRGTISLNASGTSDRPITLKGDGWGPEKARLEGADVWQGKWIVCPSPAFAKGNQNFAKIYYTSAPEGYSSFLTGLYEDGDFLWYSQEPDPTDPFYYDDNYGYFKIPTQSASIRQTRTSITDTTRLTQADTGFWNGAHVATWIQGNLVAIKPATSFDTATNTVYHEDLGGNPYGDRTSYYSLLNHVSLISRPGEYAYDPAQNRLYVWPKNSDHPDLHEYSVQLRDTAITVSSVSHATIEGFVIQRFAQAIYADSTTATGIVAQNNEISKFRSANKYAIMVNAGSSLVEGNRIFDCQRSVGILSKATDIVVRNNFVSRTSRQGIWLMGATRSQIVNNVITDIQGSHANAISVYSGAADILVANNIISAANSPITYEASSNITFFGNVVDAHDRSRPVSEWFGASGRIAFINNTFIRNPDSDCIFVLNSGTAQYVIINNIMDGGRPSSGVHDYNLFVGLPGRDLAPREELRTTLTDVFVAPGRRDWRPKVGGPAVGTGTNPSEYLPTSIFPKFDFFVDLNGNTRGANGIWNKGAYGLETVAAKSHNSVAARSKPVAPSAGVTRQLSVNARTR